MKETPLLFSAPMIRALLDDTKTQTRRLVRLDHFAGLLTDEPPEKQQGCFGPPFWRWFTKMGGVTAGQTCPYGGVGDRIWAKEAIRFVGWDEDGNVDVEYLADGARRTVRALVPDFDIWVERRTRAMMRSGAKMMQYDAHGREVEANKETAPLGAVSPTLTSRLRGR